MSDAVEIENDGRWRGPFPGQQFKFFECTARKVLYGGAGGGGKTVNLLGKFCQQLAIEGPRFKSGEIHQSQARGIYLRRNTTDLQQAIDKSHEIFLDVDPDADYNINMHQWVFPNFGDAKFNFGHMEHERSKFKYKSTDWTFIAFDELTEFTETQYEYMDTRLRTTDKKLAPMLQICAGSNPDGVGLLWVRKMFIENKEPETIYRIETVTSSGKVINYDQIFIPARLRDNPALYESGQYEASLMNKRPEVREAILEGNWYITAGAFLAECWDSHVHVVENHPVPRNATVCRSADFGTRSFSSVTWWYVDRDGAFTAFHNLYVKGHTASMLADRIREVEEFYGYWDDDANCSSLNGPLDEDCWNTTGHSGPSIAETLRRKGVRFRRSNKNRLLGAAELIGRLVERIPGATEDEPERPMIRWMVRCIDPIKTLPVLPVDPANPNLPDTTGEDHCLHGDTIVHTTKGPHLIKDLVGKSGMAYGKDGEAVPFGNVRKTYRNARLLTVILQDGREVTCTNNHKLLTNRGWVEAGRLTMAEMVWCLPKIRPSSPRQSRSSEESAITYAASTSSGEAADCTAPYGAQQMAQSQRGHTSITAMASSPTIASATSGPCQQQSTSPSIAATQQTSREQRELEMLASPPWEIGLFHGRGEPKPEETPGFVTIAALRTSGLGDVYDLEIASEDHAFLVNGGVTVHNCYDETTYMCMWRPLKPRNESEVDDDEDAPVIDIGRRRKYAGSGTLGVPPGGWG